MQRLEGCLAFFWWFLLFFFLNCSHTVISMQCTKDIKQNMSIATRLSATAKLGNCRTLFMCDYVFSEHKRLDNVNWILLEMEGISIEDKLVFIRSDCNESQIRQSLWEVVWNRSRNEDIDNRAYASLEWREMKFSVCLMYLHKPFILMRQHKMRTSK